MTKTCIDHLAILGGKAEFDQPLHVGRPNLGSRDQLFARLAELLERKWLTNNGPLVQEFEQRLAARIGVKHCVAVCNGTAALEIGARALGLAGEVIVPAFTFVATPHALTWQGLTPRFCDVDPRTHCLSAGMVEAHVGERTSGIVGVHLWGRPCDVDALQDLARRRRLKLLFDASHAFACTHGGRCIGGFGDAEVFSFHATKVLNSGEGGAVATNDDALAQRLRLLRNFGFAGYDTVVHLGINGKMSELAAALGLTNLESLDAFVAANRRNFEAYRAGLAGLPGITLIAHDQRERHNYQYVVVEVDAAKAGIDRDLLVDVLWKENVLARRYFYPGCHRMEPYRSLDPAAAQSLPVTDRLAERVLVLPTGTDLDVDDVGRVCSLIALVLGHGSALRARLGPRADDL